MGDKPQTTWGRTNLSPTRGRPQMSQGGGWARTSPRRHQPQTQDGETSSPGFTLRNSSQSTTNFSNFSNQRSSPPPSSSSSSTSFPSFTSSISSSTQKSKIDWDALSDEDEGGEEGGGERKKTGGGGGGGEKGKIDWDALSDDEEGEGGGERKKTGGGGGGGYDWDALSDEEEEGGDGGGKGKIDWDNLSDGEGGEEGGEEGKGEGGGMFDYLDALLSDDEEEEGGGGGAGGGGKINWDNLSDGEEEGGGAAESEEKKKRDEQLRARIFAALDEEMEQEQQYQQEQKKKRMTMAPSFSASSSFSSSKPKKLFKQSMGKGGEKETEGEDPFIPCYMASYIIDVWAKANPNFQKTIKQGYLNKAGPSKKTTLKVFHRRWVVLTDTTLTYYEKFGDHEPKGTFPISSVSSVRDSSDSELAGVGFEVVTPNRLFLFSADSPDAQKEWIRTLLMASSTAKGGATGRGGGGGEGKGREVVLKCSCEGFTKLVKAEVGVGYEVLREKLKEKFNPMFPDGKALLDKEIYLPSEKVWLKDVLGAGGVVSDYLTGGRSTVVELKRR